jgi:short subunit dehydrogenase-like uncharacterized protein
MRTYDIVVLGATGFTGRLIVEYLLQQYGTKPVSFKVALAGRNLDKLHGVAASLKADHLVCLKADNDDLNSLQQLAKQCKVIVTTVGPYKLHGAKLVQACSASGTHLVDLTVESLWVREVSS